MCSLGGKVGNEAESECGWMWVDDVEGKRYVGFLPTGREAGCESKY